MAGAAQTWLLGMLPVTPGCSVTLFLPSAKGASLSPGSAQMAYPMHLCAPHGLPVLPGSCRGQAHSRKQVSASRATFWDTE